MSHPLERCRSHGAWKRRLFENGYPIFKKNFVNRQSLLHPTKGLKIIVIFRCTFRRRKLQSRSRLDRESVDALSTTELIALGRCHGLRTAGQRASAAWAFWDRRPHISMPGPEGAP